MRDRSQPLQPGRNCPGIASTYRDQGQGRPQDVYQKFLKGESHSKPIGLCFVGTLCVAGFAAEWGPSVLVDSDAFQGHDCRCVGWCKPSTCDNNQEEVKTVVQTYLEVLHEGPGTSDVG